MADFAHLSATMERMRAKKAKNQRNLAKKMAKKAKQLKPEDGARNNFFHFCVVEH
jgi:hypothetical protein